MRRVCSLGINTNQDPIFEVDGTVVTTPEASGHCFVVAFGVRGQRQQATGHHCFVAFVLHGKGQPLSLLIALDMNHGQRKDDIACGLTC